MYDIGYDIEYTPNRKATRFRIQVMWECPRCKHLNSYKAGKVKKTWPSYSALRGKLDCNSCKSHFIRTHDGSYVPEDISRIELLTAS